MSLRCAAKFLALKSLAPKLFALKSAALAGLIASAASAADYPTRPYAPPPTGSSDTYIVTITGNGVIQPTFPGSDELTGVVYPSLSFRRSDEPARFTAPDDGISISVLDNPSLRIGPVFRYQAGRYLEDDRRLFGLRKLNFDIESGAFIEYWPVTFMRVRLEARHGFQRSAGFAGNFGIDFVYPYQKFTFSLGPRLSFGDVDYVRRYFGVTPAESAASGRFAAFRPDGGITGVGGLGSVTYQWNETWATTGYVKYERLVDDAGASPIVRSIGSVDQFTFGVKVNYSFNFRP